MSRCLLACLLAAGCQSSAVSPGPSDAAQPADAGSADHREPPPGDGPPPGTPDVAAACVIEPGGAQGTWSPYRATISWRLSGARDGGVPGGPGDGGAAAAAGCAVADRARGCRGAARARRSGGRLELAFDDGSLLTWDPTLVRNPVSPPVVADGDTVWVEYSHVTKVVCPVCGSSSNAELSLRKGPSGQVLWLAREGHTQSNLGAALAQELFGVGFREQPGCRATFEAGCWSVERTVLDHVLETQPPQLLRHGKLERVTTAKGRYDLVWAHSRESAAHRQNCADGPVPASDTGFAASWLSP